MSDSRATEALTELGFTELEAEIYVFLLSHPPATGYRIAKGVGRTNANTYQALESLKAKGAVLVSDGRARLCRAVAPGELMAQLGRRFESARSRAGDVLEHVATPVADDRVYQLSRREQVLEKARSMLEVVGSIVVADLFPEIADELREALVETARRGAKVNVKIYRRIDLEPARAVLRQRGEEIVDRMPFDSITLNVDGKQHLVAALERGGGEPAASIWTSNPVLAYGGYHSLIYELMLTELQQAIRAGESSEELVARLDSNAYLHPIGSHNEVYRDFLTALGKEEFLAELGLVEPSPSGTPTGE